MKVTVTYLHTHAYTKMIDLGIFVEGKYNEDVLNHEVQQECSLLLCINKTNTHVV